MISRKQGIIINIASVNGLTGIGAMAYSAGKAGVMNLTQNMAIRYGRFNVRVNAVCPGTIRTPIFEPVIESNPEILDGLVKHYPLGRIGEPDDVAKAVLFLASDDSSWITGQVLVVDGGFTAGYYSAMTENLDWMEGLDEAS